MAIKSISASGFKTKNIDPPKVTINSPTKDLSVKATVAPAQGHSAFTTGLGKGYELATRSQASTTRLAAAMGSSPTVRSALAPAARET